MGAFAEFERNLIQERINAGLTRARQEGTVLGRKKGSKDKKVRRKSGYLLRWSKSK
jgi:DNA invertase Pin-like site-specific DNA recombinase